jgi:molybdenum transport protein
LFFSLCSLLHYVLFITFSNLLLSYNFEIKPQKSMIYFTDEELERLISEDVPYYDMTTRLTRFGSQLAKIQFHTKEPTVICGTEEVMRLFSKLSISPTLLTLSGEYIEGHVKFLEAEGLAKHLHTIWRISSNILEYASGIATRTKLMIEAAKKENQDIIITGTRKTIPYTRKIVAKAILVGGGDINRLGLSDNILFFKNHYKFFGGLNGLLKKFDQIKKDAFGKSITIETDNGADALALCEYPVDVIQLDSMSPDEVRKLTEQIKNINPTIRVAAAGGINIENVKDYASTGIDIIVTSFPNYCKPADFRVEIDPLID